MKFVTTVAPKTLIWKDKLSQFTGTSVKYVTTSASLKNHVESVHDKEKPFMCANYDYCWSQKPNLKRHDESVHGNKKPFKCKICDYSRNTYYILTQFMWKRNHSNVKFVTSVGPKNLMWKDMLSQFKGIRSHSNVKYVTTAAPIN